MMFDNVYFFPDLPADPGRRLGTRGSLPRADGALRLQRQPMGRLRRRRHHRREGEMLLLLLFMHENLR